MLARSKSIPAEIAAGVPVPAEILAARDRITVLRQTQSALFAEQGKIEQRSRRHGVNAVDDRRRPEITRELRSIHSEEQENLRVIAKHKPTYAAAVAQVLAPLRRSAMQTLITAISDLQEADVALNIIVAEINAAGGQVKELPSPVYLEAVKTAALAMLAECNKGQ